MSRGGQYKCDFGKGLPEIKCTSCQKITAIREGQISKLMLLVLFKEWKMQETGLITGFIFS